MRYLLETTHLTAKFKIKKNTIFSPLPRKVFGERDEVETFRVTIEGVFAEPFFVGGLEQLRRSIFFLIRGIRLSRTQAYVY